MRQLQFENKVRNNGTSLRIKVNYLSKHMAEVQKIILNWDGREDAYQTQNSETRRLLEAKRDFLQ